MQELKVPTNLGNAAVNHPELRRWVVGLPGTVARLCDRWALTLEEPFEPGGTCSWVAPVRGSSSSSQVLKVAWRHAESRDEARGLRAWKGDGTVRLYDEECLGATTAMLLERCRPGTALGDLLSEDDQDDAIGSLLPRLWIQPMEGHGFRTLAEMCDGWANDFERGLADAPPYLDRTLAADGIATFRALSRQSKHAVLLCTDLHAANILAADREPWLVIDPKPYVGDRTYDALQHMLNCWHRLSVNPVALVERIAGVLDLDRTRLRSWLFSRCIKESLEFPALYPVARALAP